MSCGQQLIEAVADLLSPEDGMRPELAQHLLAEDRDCIRSLRAIRYAITELIRSGRARRDGKYGPVYAVRAE